jgi:predicted nucleic acid-binding protein
LQAPSSIAASELAFGAAKGGSLRSRKALEQFMLPLDVAPFDAEAALPMATSAPAWSGEER